MAQPALFTALRQPRALGLIGCMWFAYFLNYCDRQVVFALFPVLKSQLGFTDEQLGLTGSIFLWVYGVGCPIAGQLGDRFSKRLLIISSLVIWSWVTVATGFSTGVIMLLLLRAAMGVSEALYMPAAVALTGGAFPASIRSRALAALSTAQIAGTVAGSWFGGAMGDEGRWREAFFMLGAIGLVYAVPYYLFLRTIDEPKPPESKSPLETFSSGMLFRIPTFVLLCVVFPIFVFGLWLLYSWLPNFLHDKFSLSLRESAFNATMYLQGATLLGVAAGGYLADALYRRTSASRYWLLTASLFLCAPSLYALGRCQTLELTRLAAAAFGVCSGLFMGNIFSAAYDVIPARTRASAVGVLNLFGAVISGFAPYIGGRSKETIGIAALLGWTALAYVAAGLALVGGIALLFPADHARLQDERRTENA